MNNTFITACKCPSSQEPIFLGNKGNGGTASIYRAWSRSPLLNVWGTGGTQTCF